MSHFTLSSCASGLLSVLYFLSAPVACSPNSESSTGNFVASGHGGTTGSLETSDPLPSGGGDDGPSLGTAAGGANSATTVAAEVWPSKQCAGKVVDGALGAYCLGPAVKAGDAAAVSHDNAATEAGCGSTVWGIVRDFVTFPGNLSAADAALVTYASKDFGMYCCNVQKGMVATELGADKKPVFTGVGVTSGPQMMTSAEDFNKWYNDVEGFNAAYYVAFHLMDKGTGVFSFAAADEAHQYFPVDAAGFDSPASTDRNYSFTTEVHTRFLYRGGEVFSFTGDDDLWVFINGKLAIDLGGVHSASTDSIRLDDRATELGLVIGNVYTMDLFNAERHAGGSNFQVETSLSFVDCGTAPPAILQ